jgi:hypothetical protein
MPQELSALIKEVSQSWDPQEIARIQAAKTERTEFIREWVQVTNPEERFRWKDPNPDQNGYL